MEHYSWYNIAVVCFAAFGSLFTGYSLAVFAFTIGQPTFYSSLGLEHDPTAPGYSYTNDVIGASNGVFFGTGFFGCFLAGWAGNRFGRVNGFRIAAATGIIGGALQCASQSPAMFLVSRAVAGLAAGHTMAAMPTYFTEVSPPRSRGLITGAHAIFINIGYCTAGWIGFGCYFTPDSQFAWRFPFAMVVIWGLCLLTGSFYVPESPRFLVQHDDHQGALAVLVRLHRNSSDPNDDFAREELQMIIERCRTEKEMIRTDGRWRLFTKEANRRRLVLAWLVMVAGVELYHLVALISSLQHSGLDRSLYWWLDIRSHRSKEGSDYWICVDNMCLCNPYGTDCTIQHHTTRSWAIGSTTMIYIYVLCYNSFIDLNQFTVATEIFSTHVRNQASAMAISGLFLADILWLNLLPTAMATIGWRYYLVFVCLAVVHSIYLMLYLPETSGWHLEEMDRAMADGIDSSKAVQQDESVKSEGDVIHIETME